MRKVYCITYDLKIPGRDYQSLYDAIMTSGDWWHQSGSVWYIYSTRRAIDILNHLRIFTDSNDKVFVIEVGKDWAGINFSEEEYNWLRAHI